MNFRSSIPGATGDDRLNEVVSAASVLASPKGRDRSKARMVRGTLGLINRSVMLSDAVATFGGVIVCRRPFIGIEPPLNASQTLIIATVAAVSVFFSLQGLGAYRVERYRNRRDWMLDLAIGWGVAMVMGGLLLAAFEPLALKSHRCLAVWALATLVVMLAGRSLTGMAFAGLAKRGFLRRRVAVVGGSDLADTVVRHLRNNNSLVDYELVGRFQESSKNTRTDRSRLAMGDVEDLCLLAQRQQVDVIVLAVPWRRSVRIFELAERIQWISADVVVPFDGSGLLSHSRLMTDIAGIPMLQLVHHPFKGTQGVVKVAQDYIVAGIALVVVAPIMAAAALALYVTSGAPVMFRQTRMGFNGRPFYIHKFRTMTVDPNDDGTVGAVKDDPRVTRIGAFMRRTSIDELPQLFNVLCGEMSIVGPRPHVPNMLVGQGSYVETVHSYAARHRIKPGITGWAQINGMRGGIDTPAKARDGVDLDLYYIKNWSLKLDLHIMVRTITSHLFGPAVF